MNTIKSLENWVNKHKSHTVNISIDNGYGASCWTVVLYGNKCQVHVSETNFIGEIIDEYKNDSGEMIYQVVVIDGNGMDEWPGLEATINLAIDTAEQKGL